MLIYKSLSGESIAALDSQHRCVFSVNRHTVELQHFIQQEYKQLSGNDRYNASRILESIFKYHYKVVIVNIIPDDNVTSEYFIG